MQFLVGLLFFGSFGALGLLVGSLCGLSASPLASGLIGLSFSLIGGSILNLFSRLQPLDRVYSLLGLLAFSVATFAGVIGGIYVSEHRLLSASVAQTPSANAQDNKYLRTSEGACLLTVQQRGAANNWSAERILTEAVSECAATETKVP